MTSLSIKYRPIKTVTVYGPDYPIQIQVEVNDEPMTKEGTNVESAAASMLRERSKVKPEDVVDVDALQLAQERLKNTPVLGPGECILIQEDPLDFIRYLTRQLKELPNAFDLVTGKLNQENHKAVMLYASLQVAIEHAKYPVIYKKNDQ